GVSVWKVSCCVLRGCRRSRGGGFFITFLPAMGLLAEELGWELLLEKVTTGPERVLGSESDSWTLFDPKETWTYNEQSNTSLSSNHPWFGKELKGKVKYCIQKGQLLQVND
ncbi:MAG: hypothetical protein ACKO44_07190, partial [Algoriphagus sp.]